MTRQRIFLFAILLLAAGLRFTRVGDIRYGYDHSYPAYQALALLDGGRWPVIGQPSSVFLDNPALMAYIQAIPLAIGRSPVAVELFILVLNTAAVWFVYRAAADMLDRDAGLVAAFLMAINPWIIHYSRTTWVQSLLPFFMAVIAWGLWQGWVAERASNRRFLAGGLAVTLITQTYVAAWGVLPQIGLLLLIFRKRTPRRPFLIALAVFLIAASLYAAGLWTRAGANTGKVQGILETGFSLATSGASHALRFMNGMGYRAAYAAGNPAAAFWDWANLAAVVLLTVAFVLGLVQAARGLRRGDRERRAAIVLLVWFLTPMLLTLPLGSAAVHPHYLLLTLPAGQVIAAWGVRPALQRRRLGVATAAALVACGLIFGHDLFRANQLVAAQPIWPKYDGWALDHADRLGRRIRAWQLANPGDYPRRVVAAGNKALLSGLSATFLEPVGEVEYPDFVLLDDDRPLLYVTEGPGPVAAWLESLVTIVPDGGENATGAPVFSLIESRPANGARIEQYPQAAIDWPSAAGLTLAGYTLNGEAVPGGTLELITVWRVDDLHPERDEWFVSGNLHLVDEGGQIISNVGGHGQWAYRWELGDTYVERTVIPIPETAAAGPYHLDIGLIDPIRQATFPFSTPDGQRERYSIPLAIATH